MAKDPKAVVVEAYTMQKAEISQYQYAQGTIKSVRREYLVFQNSGRVAFIKTSENGETLQEGDYVKGPSNTVKKGELLAELDHRKSSQQIKSARAQLDSARIKLRQAKKAFARGKELKQRSVIGAQQYEQYEADYQQSLVGVRQAEADLDRLEVGLDDSQLRAPFDGQIAFINIREGDYITPQQFDTTNQDSAARTAPIVLIDPKNFQVEVNLPLYTGRYVKKGQPAYIIDQETLAKLQVIGEKNYQSLSDEFVPAQVLSVSPAVNPKDRSIRARIRSTEVTKPLLNGDFVTVWIAVAQKQNALVLPMNALINQGNKHFTFVIDANNEVHKREVKLGILGTEGVEIVSGLKVGDRVVTRGKARMSDGLKVKVAKTEQLSESNQG